METNESEKKLEKFLKKLENIDIREWNCHQGQLTTEQYGLKFTLGESYLYIENVTGNLCTFDYNRGNIKNKPLQKMLKQFHDTTYVRLQEHQQKELEEKIESFLSE